MENDLSQALEAGTILIFETGSYSDKNWHGPVRLLKKASKQQMADAYRASPGEKVPWDDDERCHSGDDFLPWLIANGWVEGVENVHSWHVGDCSSFEP